MGDTFRSLTKRSSPSMDTTASPPPDPSAYSRDSASLFSAPGLRTIRSTTTSTSGPPLLKTAPSIIRTSPPTLSREKPDERSFATAALSSPSVLRGTGARTRTLAPAGRAMTSLTTPGTVSLRTSSPAFRQWSVPTLAKRILRWS